MKVYPGRLVIGFHACKREDAEKVLAGSEREPSKEDFDWLGNGVYFWEHDYTRAWKWATETKKYKAPYVVGAYIDLGHCLDLANSDNMDLLKIAYDRLLEITSKNKVEMPENTTKKNNINMKRYLDCAVIETAKKIAIESEKPFDSVRGVFWEGSPPYPGTDILHETHTQIAVQPSAIHGYFRPKELWGLH